MSNPRRERGTSSLALFLVLISAITVQVAHGLEPASIYDRHGWYGGPASLLLAKAFGVDTSNIPIVDRGASDGGWISKGLPELTDDQERDMHVLLAKYVILMRLGYFSAAERISTELREDYRYYYSGVMFNYSPRYKISIGANNRIFSDEEIYIYWPTFYKRLYTTISSKLCGKRRLIWMPVMNKLDYVSESYHVVYFACYTPPVDSGTPAIIFSANGASIDLPTIVVRAALFDQDFTLLQDQVPVPVPGPEVVANTNEPYQVTQELGFLGGQALIVGDPVAQGDSWLYSCNAYVFVGGRRLKSLGVRYDKSPPIFGEAICQQFGYRESLPSSCELVPEGMVCHGERKDEEGKLYRYAAAFRWNEELAALVENSYEAVPVSDR